MANPTSIKLDDELKGRVQNVADTHRRSAHWIMREAIQQYVEREEKQEAFKQETLQAWENYQSTGLHSTNDEVENWLNSWGTEDETQAPTCHK